MPAFSSFAMAAMTAAAVGGSIHGANMQNKAREDAENKTKEAKAAQDKLLKEQEDAKAQEAYNAETDLTRDAEIHRQKSLAQKAQGRSGTIMTEGYGQSQPSPLKNKLGV